MLEIILPCPNCQTSLLVDEQNAGTDVLCPGCDARLTLPRDLSGASQPEMKRPPADPASAPAQSQAHALAQAQAQAQARKNHPLHRTGHMNPLPEDAVNDGAPAPPPPAEQHRTHLPERRGLSPEEEMRRLAALTADPGTFDLHNVDTKGRTAFPCPACHRPVWIAGSEWGQEMVCDGCSQAIKAPDPSTGEPAKVLQPAGTEQRQKTVLPARRQVEDMNVGEQTAIGRSKRQSAPPPPPAPREAAPAPERARPAPPPREPIPARGDADFSAPVRKGPPARRTVTPSQEQSAAAAEFEAATTPQPAGDVPQGKFVQRLGGTERTPSFTPKHEADLSVETTGNWGGNAPLEQTPAFRRTFTAAILTLILGAVGITAYLLSDYFKEKPAHSGKPAEEESPVQNVDLSRTALTRFFAAQTPEDMAKEVRHPEKTLPRMKEWYARNGVTRQKVEFTDKWRELDNWQQSGVNFIFTVIKLDGVPQREIALETFPDGRPPQLDWEDFTAWSETPWIDFLKTTSERPAEFRVSVTLIDYYNGFYSDRHRYLAFRVSDRNNDYCYAYCTPNSDVSKAILGAMRTDRQAGRSGTGTGEDVAEVILRLRFLPEGKEFNQAAIDAVVWNSWLQP